MVYGAVLGVSALLPPVCPLPTFWPPGCAHICYGVVSGAACICPPGRFGVSCNVTAAPNPALSILLPVVLQSGKQTAVAGPAGDGVLIPAGALNQNVSLSVKAYSLVPEVGEGQVCTNIPRFHEHSNSQVVFTVGPPTSW